MRYAVDVLHSNFRHRVCIDAFERLLQYHAVQIDTFFFHLCDLVLQQPQSRFVQFYEGDELSNPIGEGRFQVV